ncbi:YchJ family protein [Ferrimonas balearica]|uniref:YchJ family protein n=1 Tax=Ferrimonas balearica TaxID=44012 RepID=UPI001C9A1CB5|nr:YchJ family protein [Ferrimonas balearica]MBY5920098.1 YchJ family protein [Ferrimonas balearica]MBY5997217.1 YchJ family protein [Ferrimonas balearica]
MTQCPCGSTLDYATCCQPLHDGHSRADTPEQLMRSRYSAYVLAKAPYLLATHHIDYRGALSEAELLASCQQTQWQRLEILDAPAHEGDKGEVEFRAWYRDGTALRAMHERSRFVREQGQWLYCDGRFDPKPQANRNAPCPCGSGKKFKRCCGA